MGEREHTLRPAEVAQAVHAKVDEVAAIGQVVRHQLRRGGRQQHLAAVSDRAQASAADHRGAEVVALVAQLRVPGVQRHPHPQRRAVGPVLGGQRALGVERRRQRVAGAREDGDDTVTLPLLDRAHAAVRGDRRVEDLVMARDRVGHRRGRCLPQPRRALDVGQQERDRPRRHPERR